ncbi:hypothetical protein [Burkholderia sp. JP2-270]|uniref:hypothetical protein n=1 Tax=Burkholderia sp. JP2-270 TaxID=2217913 RepID=UPI0013A6E3E8|nr:hypothetical protein [Burkholderia sp. JP2-270]
MSVITSPDLSTGRSARDIRNMQHGPGFRVARLNEIERPCRLFERETVEARHAQCADRAGSGERPASTSDAMRSAHNMAAH